MPFVTIRRLSFKKVNPNDLPEYGGAPQEVILRMMLEELEQEIQEAVAAIPILETTPDKVMVSIQEEQERGGNWWQNPTVEIDFVDTKYRRPFVKRAALEEACIAVWRKYPAGYLESVWGYYHTMEPTECFKITSEAQ